MSLGQTICRLRTKKGYSQSELAEMLGVSRQSVSKWETDASAPDMDNLVRLHEILEVSLDELILGQAPPPPAPAPAAPQGQRMPGHTLAGILLAGLGAACFLLRAGLLTLPLLVLALICFLCRRRCGLWCGWAVYGMAFAFCLPFTRFGYLLDPGRSLFRLLLDPEGVIGTCRRYPFDLVVALGAFALLLLLIGATLHSFSSWRLAPSPGKRAAVATGGAVYLFLHLTVFLPPPFYSTFLSIFVPLTRFALLTALLCAVAALRRGK